MGDVGGFTEQNLPPLLQVRSGRERGPVPGPTGGESPENRRRGLRRGLREVSEGRHSPRKPCSPEPFLTVLLDRKTQGLPFPDSHGYEL